MKKIKKLTSLVMAAMMVLTVTVTANAEGEEVLVNETFEGTVSSSTWTGKYEISNGLNKSITSSSDGTEFYCRLGKTVESGAMLVSYDVMLPDVASDTSVRIKQVWDSASASEGKRAYLLEATTKGKITINGTELCNYVPGQWYNITEVVDVKNKKIYAYVDGKCKNECAWRNDGEASGINCIQTEYSANTVYIDNAYVAEYADKTEADTALSNMLKSKVSLEKNSFEVGASKLVHNPITPVEKGAVVVSYDITTTTGRPRLMQIYDNQSSAKRSVLVQLDSKGVILVNGNDTGVTWTHNTPNNLTLVYDAENKTSTIYYNGIRAGKENYAVHSENGINLADIITQDDSGSGLTVSNAWARSFASYADAVKYVNAINNAKNEDVMEYYSVEASQVSAAIADYDRALNSITATDTEKSEIINEMSAMMPYKNIFSENFDAITEIDKRNYVAATNLTVTDGKLQLTNSGSRARLLKSVSGSTNLVTECDFMQESRSNIDSIVRVTDNTGNHESVKVYAELGDIKMLYGPGMDGKFNEKTLVSNYNTNQWYNIKIYSNFTEKIASVYIDDVFMGTYTFMSTSMENLNRVFDSYTNSAGTYYIDNIKVYNDAILETSSALSVDTKAVENIALPLAVGNYGVSWTTSNPDYIGADGTVAGQLETSQPVTLTANVSNGFASVDTKFTTRVVGSDKFEIGKVTYADANEFSTETRAGAIGEKRGCVNKNDDSTNGTLIVAMYGQSGKLIKSKIVDAVEGQNLIASTITEDVTKIKIFVWDEDLANCTPYAQLLEIN